MDNDAFENRRLAVVEEDHAQQQQESCHCADGHNNNPTPMMVLVHNSPNGALLTLRVAAFDLLDAEWNSAVTFGKDTDSLFLTQTGRGGKHLEGFRAPRFETTKAGASLCRYYEHHAGSYALSSLPNRALK